jgi:hypothetical protein
MKMAVFWVLLPSDLIPTDPNDGETSVIMYQITWRKNPEGSHLHKPILY